MSFHLQFEDHATTDEADIASLSALHRFNPLQAVRLIFVALKRNLKNI